MIYVHKYEILKILNILKINNLLMKENFKADAYEKAIEKVLNDEEVTFKRPSKILDKIDEIEKTGTLKNYENLLGPKYKLYEEFKKIFGVGEKKAIELAIKHNNFDEIEIEKLNRVQKLGLKYFNEIQTKISKEIIKKHSTKIKKLFKDQIKTQIVGSYRRSLGVTSKNENLFNDLDILVVSNEPSLKNIFDKNNFLESFSFGDKKFSGLSKINNSIIRVDILLTSPKEYPFALLYFTGPKAFNISMRHEAKSQGLLLNEHGLSGIDCDDEKDIFNALNLKYMTLKERDLMK